MNKCTVQFKRTQKGREAEMRLKRQVVARPWKGLNDNIKALNLTPQTVE